MVEQTPPTRHIRSRRNVAFLLIGAGVIIFLANTGVLGSAIWDALWPIALIAVGVDLITAGEQRRRVVVGALLGAAVLVPLISGAQLFGRESGAVSVQPGADAPRAVALGEVKRIRANISQTAGNLSIRAADDGADAVRIIDGRASVRYTPNGDVGQLKIDSSGWSEGNMALELTPRVPFELTVDVTSGSADPIDLRDVPLAALQLSVTGGNANVRLPGQGAFDVAINNIAGNVEITVPASLAARIEVADNFGNVEVDQRFRAQGNGYITDDYSDTAANRATIRVDAAGGNVSIRSDD